MYGVTVWTLNKLFCLSEPLNDRGRDFVVADRESEREREEREREMYFSKATADRSPHRHLLVASIISLNGAIQSLSGLSPVNSSQ